MRYHWLPFIASLSIATAACKGDVQSLGSMTSSSTSETGLGGHGQSSTQQGGAGTTHQGGGGDGGAHEGGSGGQGGSAPAVAYARFGYMNGQETIGDFCVSYAQDPSGGYVWETQGVLAASQIDVKDYAGLERLTRYVPLSGAPVAFGFTYPGATCADAHGLWNGPNVPAGFSYFTVLAVPYSGEAMQVWSVGDPVAINEAASTAPGLRIVNASSYSQTIDVSTQFPPAVPVSIGQFAFANSPTDYTDVGADHLWLLHVNDVQEGPGLIEFDFTQLDLLPIRPRRTIYYTRSSFAAGTVLACADTTDTQPGDPKSSSCHLVDGQSP